VTGVQTCALPIWILASLSRRVGPHGRVVGVDLAPMQIAAARAGVQALGLGNVDIVNDDAFHSALRPHSFDLVHARFLAAPTGRLVDLLAEARRLARPGGVIAIEEPDSASWQRFPASPAWVRLKELILTSFSAGGGDLDAGRKTFSLMRESGLHNVEARAAVLALPGGHPYARLPLQFAVSLTQRILHDGLTGRVELDELIAECDRAVSDACALTISFTVVQTWGRT